MLNESAFERTTSSELRLDVSLELKLCPFSLGHVRGAVQKMGRGCPSNGKGRQIAAPRSSSAGHHDARSARSGLRRRTHRLRLGSLRRCDGGLRCRPSVEVDAAVDKVIESLDVLERVTPTRLTIHF